MKKLILTICQGDTYKKISELTHPSIKAYANKMGAEFLIISEKKISVTTPHWEKFQIFDLLNEYERILFVDTDIIIREDCPNLFDIVPKTELGLFNEADFVDRSKELMIDVCKEYGVKLKDWNGKYYNTGVMIISRCHKYLFKKPEKEYCSFYEQSYLNMKIADSVLNGDLKIFDLEYRFNRMNCLDVFTGEDRQASYIIHYAGCPVQSLIFDLIVKDLEIWKRDVGKYVYKKHIYVSVSGGLGDQVDAEPAIRFMREKIYPNDEIVVATHHPRLFKHLNVDVYLQGKFPGAVDIPYYQMKSLPTPESSTWAVVSNLMCHTVDYCSIAMLKRTLPMVYKQIKLVVDKDDLDAVEKLVNKPEELLVVHPGRHWQSKTLPLEYWQELIDKLANIGRVCVIGKNDGTRGVLDVICKEGIIDLRDLLDLGSMIALLSKAKILISNDSAPVHIAGAFDNWIALIPTCKHPDHVLPYRNNGNVYHKAMTLYKKLPSDEFNSQPTCVHGSTAEFTQYGWDEYLLPTDEVIEKIKEIL